MEGSQGDLPSSAIPAFSTGDILAAIQSLVSRMDMLERRGGPGQNPASEEAPTVLLEQDESGERGQRSATTGDGANPYQLQWKHLKSGP